MMVTSRLQNSRIGNHISGTPGTLKRLEIPDIFLVCNIEFQSKLRLFSQWDCLANKLEGHSIHLNDLKECMEEMRPKQRIQMRWGKQAVCLHSWVPCFGTPWYFSASILQMITERTVNKKKRWGKKMSKSNLFQRRSSYLILNSKFFNLMHLQKRYQTKPAEK